MSMLIKGIDLPKCSNEECIIVIRKDKAEVLQTGYKKRIVEVIQISKPHGRIIDVDNLIPQEVWIDEMSFEAVDYDDIKDVPTILEGEK